MNDDMLNKIRALSDLRLESLLIELYDIAFENGEDGELSGANTWDFNGGIDWAYSMVDARYED